MEPVSISTRNRRNKARGGAFERWVAAQFGGRRTGPLLGKDDVVVGEAFAIQCKKTIRPIYRPAIRRYLDALRLAFPTSTAVLAYARPGDNRHATLTLYEQDWLALHGPGDDIPLTRHGDLVTVPLREVAELYGVTLDMEVSEMVASPHA